MHEAGRDRGSRRELLERILADPSCRTIYITGECDSGKSFLAHELFELLSSRGAVGLLDCDPGQGTSGPPGTIGLGTRRGGEGETRLCFVGATSPSRAMAETLSAIGTLADTGRRLGLDRLVVDSCGFVTGPAGRELQRSSAELVRADLVIELSLPGGPGLGELRLPPGCAHVRLARSPLARTRSGAERRDLRRRLFAGYFAAAVRRRYLSASVPTDALPRLAEGRGLLLGMEDRDGLLAGLALLESVDPAGGSFIARSPVREGAAVRRVRAGSLRLDESFREVADAPPGRVTPGP